ncbi:MAG: hypothetical protein IJ563_01625 [Selenomonadaceae bacterium]|nr:hypothetical protein [Selenomonadaceae bacterium]
MKRKTIFNVFMFMTMMMITSVCSAMMPVRVCDYGSDGFYYRYNQIAEEMNLKNVMMNKMPYMDNSNENYDTYIATCGPAIQGTVISLSVNKIGYVSRIMVMSKANDTIAEKNLGDTLVIILALIGLTRAEMEYFIFSWQDETDNAVHWCESARRYIIVNDGLNSNQNTRVVRISAGIDS